MKRRRGTIAPSSDVAPSLFDAPSVSPAVEHPSLAPSIADVYEEVGESFPGASPRSAIAVSTLTQTVKDVVEGAFIPLWVRGEISDFKAHRNGHWYFCLRDLTSQLKCVVWSRDQRGIPAAPDDGMQVAALGQLGVYAARGEMQFTVRRMEADGDGLWRKALELTRVRLEADGLLAPGRKRPLPRYPRRIAIVTSASGAALRDVIAVLRRRAPGVELIVSHAAVQGESAPLEICAALERVCRWGGAELVIIGRGGGSREDLWAFNDERVVRAVAACPVPTISAVGHEVDITLCDLVADLRAPTPSAAAEAAVPSREEMLLTIAGHRQRLVSAMESRVAEPRERARDASRLLVGAVSRRLADRQSSLAAVAGRLHALSPLATLERGYAVARLADGRRLASVDDVTPGDAFELRLRDGRVNATANTVHPTNPAAR
ncbi:MAG TPA: exodeoxyribonuclease VII large subunit [Gemmatimonadaceae bacterium]|jgi:exodeoxyribonuclease VII large subunit|nr:exodeoxyribonuclease VII large subunit [Gemmatimonadaceae bacterium]